MVLPQMNADARGYFGAVGSFEATSRIDGKSLPATTIQIVSSTAQLAVATNLPATTGRCVSAICRS
ncbi:MAG TPA: hypothetical protein VMB73_31700 [Acetobacteraceae bacterium]|jgi:hypothetical protein|nr:hypothetical protein [Acetobacteraceae bacterium]